MAESERSGTRAARQPLNRMLGDGNVTMEKSIREGAGSLGIAAQ